MNQTVGIIDMDGFTIAKKFYCKELGVINIKNDEGSSYHFNLGIKWQDLSPKDRQNCKLVSEKIHKLQFEDPNGIPLANLEGIVRDFYESIKRDTLSTIGYKGGHFERDLLRKLKIPSVNLEDFGCPKAVYLFEKLAWLETCGMHIGKDPYLHCPKVEVEAFGCWLKEKSCG